ncbi:MAG: GNAT family N-acetyltransferase [Patescibacteria group bacterium]|nr:GNAT family N-acetyltransferase [Patescibacteria group bacterium]
MAEIDGEAVGTMSVVYDDGKLPTDELFSVETSRVRDTSTQLAYYGTFAVKAGMWRSGTNSIGLALIHEAVRRAKLDGVDAAIIIVHPRHVSFYKALGFEEVARRDDMPGLEKAPAVMLVITGKAAQDLFERCTTGCMQARMNSCPG